MSEKRPDGTGADEGAGEHGLALPEDAHPEVEIVSFGDSDEPAAAPAGAADEAARLRDEHEELRSRYLRLRADFENFRKRVERERGESARRAIAEPIRELLPVVDNLERALAAAGEGEELRGGVELILRQLVDVLRKFGVAEIPALGLAFDPEVHEAVARVEDPGVAAPTVVAELQRGYWLQDRLLRPAMVRVAVPAEHDVPAAPAGGPAGGRGE
jgi:molecular chaperone GrpE